MQGIFNAHLRDLPSIVRKTPSPIAPLAQPTICFQRYSVPVRGPELQGEERAEGSAFWRRDLERVLCIILRAGKEVS